MLLRRSSGAGAAHRLTLALYPFYSCTGGDKGRGTRRVVLVVPTMWMVPQAGTTGSTTNGRLIAFTTELLQRVTVS